MSLSRIIVPFEGGHLSESVLHLACEMVHNGASIAAVHVVEVPRAEPIGAEKLAISAAEDLLKRAREIGHRHQVTVDTLLVKARDVPDGIIEAARDIHADAIVMSLRHQHRPEETLLLSHNTSRILRGAPCQVLIVHEPA